MENGFKKFQRKRKKNPERLENYKKHKKGKAKIQKYIYKNKRNNTSPKNIEKKLTRGKALLRRKKTSKENIRKQIKNLKPHKINASNWS